MRAARGVPGLSRSRRCSMFEGTKEQSRCHKITSRDRAPFAACRVESGRSLPRPPSKEVELPPHVSFGPTDAAGSNRSRHFSNVLRYVFVRQNARRAKNRRASATYLLHFLNLTALCERPTSWNDICLLGAARKAKVYR
jgi:hypothetical protein